MEQPIYGSGQLSANGDTIVGQWCYEDCTSSGGAISHRIPDLYAVPVTRDNGGTLATALGDLLTVPSGALPSDQTITVYLEPLPVAPPPGYGSLRTAYDFEPNGLTFDTPVTMVFKYGAGDIPPNVPPENLRI